MDRWIDGFVAGAGSPEVFIAKQMILLNLHQAVKGFVKRQAVLEGIK
jgi:hypothetical protein